MDELYVAGYSEPISILLKFDNKLATDGILTREELNTTNINSDYFLLTKTAPSSKSDVVIPGCCGPKSCMNDEVQSSMLKCISSEINIRTNVTECTWLNSTPGCCGIKLCKDSIAQNSESNCKLFEINKTSGKSSCSWVGRNEVWMEPEPTTISEYCIPFLCNAMNTCIKYLNIAIKCYENEYKSGWIIFCFSILLFLYCVVKIRGKKKHKRVRDIHVSENKKIPKIK